MESKKKVKKSRLIYISIVVVLLLLQVVAWKQQKLQRCLYCLYFPHLGQYLWQDHGKLPIFCGRMDDRSGDRCCNISGSVGYEYDFSGMQAFGKVLPRC